MNMSRKTGLTKPITGIACCECAASGHVAAPPSRVMNSRRFMCVFHQPRIARYHTVLGKAALCITANLADECLSGVRTDKTHCEHNEPGLSPLADMRADIVFRRFVPFADSCTAESSILFDDFVGA
jgi:hypothetical protein